VCSREGTPLIRWDTCRKRCWNAQASTPLTPDPRVADAIEGLMRAGYLNRGHREDIAANVPRAYKERFARVVGIKSPCPAPPWWAVWK